MNNKLSNFDIYSKRIGFYFNDKEKIGTILGFILSIIYIFSSICFFIIYIFITINRRKIRVYDSTTYSKDLPFIEINPNLFYFAFGLENPKTSNRFIDETIYYPKVLFINRNKINGEYNTIEREELEYEVCKKENFGENYENLFLDGELNNSYCLKNYNLTLFGGYNYEKMSFLRIIIYPCINSTENNNHCKPKEIIETYLKGGHFSILTKDIGLDPSNYSFPIIPTLRSLYTTIDKAIYRDFIIYFGITEIKTDTGLFFEKMKTEKYIQFRKEFESFYFRNFSEYNEEKGLCSVDLRLDDIIYTQNRFYTKFPEIFSLIGGHMQLLYTIFSLISLLTNSIIPELKILNGIFNFNLKEKKMSLKIHSIKDFNSLFSKKSLLIPSDSQFQNFNSKIPNITRNSLKVNYMKNNSNNSNNNLSILDNNNDNNSSVINIINRKHNSLIVIKEKENENQNQNEKSNNSSSNAKIPIIKERKNNNNNNVKPNGNKNYIFKVGSFYPKFISSDKKSKISNNILKEYTYQIYFNLFDYYCFRKLSKKKKAIQLFKSGLSLYKKRMDIINVFTLLVLTEKNCLQTEDIF